MLGIEVKALKLAKRFEQASVVVFFETRFKDAMVRLNHLTGLLIKLFQFNEAGVAGGKTIDGGASAHFSAVVPFEGRRQGLQVVKVPEHGVGVFDDPARRPRVDKNGRLDHGW